MNSDYIIVQDDLNSLSNELDNYVDKLDVAISTMMASENTEIGHEAIYEYVGYEPSNESSDLDDFKKRVDDVYKSLNSIIYKKFKTFGAISNRSSEFKLTELAKLKEQITNGELVPLKSINESNMSSFNNKMGGFYATGNSLVGGPNDLISYINSLVDRTPRSSNYIKGINKIASSLNTGDVELSVPKISGYLDTKSKLTNAKLTVSRKQNISDYRMTTIVNWFTNSIDLLTVSNTTKRGIKVHTDKYAVDTDKKIGTPSNSSVIKLIDTGMSIGNKLDSIHKSLSFAIKILTRDNVISLINSSNGGNPHRFLLARFNEATVRSLISLYSNIIYVDTIIISYVKLTYGKS